MACDVAQQIPVLFAGNLITSPAQPTNATWTWNGTTWQQQHPTPMPLKRQQEQLVYDDATQQALLTGGASAPGPAALDDTRAWNGTAWTQIAGQQAPANPYERAGYDAAHQVMVVYTEPGNPKTTPSILPIARPGYGTGAVASGWDSGRRSVQTT
jgi:hypothetical protein